MSGALEFHPEVLRPAQLSVLRQLAPVARHEGFRLAGGTALALQIGHRRSIDFAWFRSAAFENPEILAATFRAAGVPFELQQTAHGTLHGLVQGVATSFFHYPYPSLRSPLVWEETDSLLAAPEDIACMKLAAVAQRGARKDFVDLYALGQWRLRLRDMLQLFKEKYSTTDIAHVLAALSYFEDAEREPMPVMLWPDDWPTIKRTIRDWVKSYAT
jgi:hypothetical protein